MHSKFFLTEKERERIEELRKKGFKILSMGEYKLSHPRRITLDELIERLPEEIPYQVDLYIAGDILWNQKTSDVVYLLLPDENLNLWNVLNRVFAHIYKGLVWIGRFRFDHYGDEIPIMQIYEKGKKIVKVKSEESKS